MHVPPFLTGIWESTREASAGKLLENDCKKVDRLLELHYFRDLKRVREADHGRGERRQAQMLKRRRIYIFVARMQVFLLSSQ